MSQGLVSKLRPLTAVWLCALLTAVISAATGMLDTTSSGSVAAAVGDSEYSADDLNAYLATVNPAGAAVRRADAVRWLSRWVFFTSLELEMAEQGVPVTDDHRAQAALEAQAALAQAGNELGFAPGAAGITTVIDQHALLLALDEWAADEIPYIEDGTYIEDEIGEVRVLCLKHVMVASQADADAVLSRLGVGEQFADLAEELSLDRGTASQGGDLGCWTEGSLRESFERAAYAAEPGEIVVVFSEVRFHVVEVTSHGPPTAEHHPQLDDERLAQLAEDIARDRVDSDRRTLKAGLQKSMYDRYADEVVVDEYYGEWDADRFMVTMPRSAAS